MPPELHLELFQHLDTVSSICLGLTCKTMYAIHYKKHGKVTLHDSRTREYRPYWKRPKNPFLAELIKDWMAHQGYIFWTGLGRGPQQFCSVREYTDWYGRNRKYAPLTYYDRLHKDVVARNPWLLAEKKEKEEEL